MKRKQIVDILLAVLAGVLCFLAFPPFGYDFLAWVCLVPLLFLIKRNNVKRAFWYSYFAGIVFFGCLIYWMVYVTVPGTIALVLIFALFYGLFGFIAGITFKYSMELLILPFVWVVLEYIRTYLPFNGFPWGLLAYTQYKNTTVIQIADIIGSYGISFILVAFNIAFFSYITRRKGRISHMIAAMAFILIMVAYGMYKLDNYVVWGTPRMSVIQGNIPQELKWDGKYADDVINEYESLTKEAAEDKTDMIIWPETAYPYLVDAKEEASEVKQLAAEIKIPVLAGMVYKEGQDYFNGAVLFSGDGMLIEKYYKLHLVPFGEYIPMQEYLSPLRRFINKPIGDYTKGESYTLFPLKSTSLYKKMPGTISHSVHFYKFGVLICFEDIFPHITREFAQKGANFMVNMTNDAWFGNTAAPEQHLQASVFRAVENRVPVVRAANTGVSCFVDSTGKILSRVERGDRDTFIKGFKTDNVRVTGIKSFYTRYGDVFAYFCGLMVALIFIVEMFMIKKEGDHAP